MNQPKESTCRVLTTETKQGVVPPHEVRTFQQDWMKTSVKYIVVEHFDRSAQMLVQVLVHWSQFSQYQKRKWPECGSVLAVILEDGTRIHAKSYSTAHYSNEAYLKAPIICRDVFKVVSLQSGYTLWEVVGVEEWAHGKRDAEADAKVLVNPYNRV